MTTNQIRISTGAENRQKERVSEMTNNTQRATRTAPAPKVVVPAIAAYSRVKEILKLGVKYGAIAEITIRPGWLVRYDKLSQAERAELAHDGPPTKAALDAAIKFAGQREELIAEFAARADVQEVERRIRESGLAPTVRQMPQRVTETIARRHKLDDTPENRENALREMGINV